MVTTQKSSKKLRNQQASPSPRGSRPARSAAPRPEKLGKRATATKPTAQNIGGAYAEVLHETPHVRRLWATTRQEGVELWLLTDAIEVEDEFRLFEALTGVRERFPSVSVRLHSINPRMFDADEDYLTGKVPRGAEEIRLSPA